ncbi:LamG domain-containing protein, partial [Patescibacteria group bacterium]
TAIGGSYFYFRSEGSVTQKQGSIDGLVGYWDFEEGSGTTAYDRTSNGNNGTITGVTYTDSKLGGALSFDGDAGDGVDIGDNLDFDVADDFSICLWFNEISTGSPLITKGQGGNPGYNGYVLDTSGSGGKVRFMLREDGDYVYYITQSSTPPASTGVWRHVCATYDGSNTIGGLNLYVNGIGDSVVVGDNGPAATFLSSYSLYIGRRESGTSSFNGSIDEVHIYNRDLSASEVTNLYEETKVKINASQDSKLTDGLIFHHTLDGNDMDWGASNESLDQVSNNDGDTVNMDNSNATIGKIGQALSFNGTNEYVRTLNTGLSSQDATFSFWVNPPSKPQAWHGFLAASQETNNDYTDGITINHCFFSTSNFETICIEGAGSVGGGLTDLMSSSYPFNTWHQVTVTSEIGTGGIKLYVDGIYEGSKDRTSSTMQLDDIKIGARYYGGINRAFFNGKMDEVRIYNRILSTNEISELYQQGQVKINASQETKLTDGLVLHQSFDGNHMDWGAGNEAIDQAITNDGNAINIDYSNAIIGKTGQALNFNGTDEYINVSDDTNLNITGNITVSTWFKADSIANWESLVGKIDGTDNWNRGYLIYYNTGNLNFYVTQFGANNASKAFTNDNEWHHVVGVYDGTNVRIFVDNVEGTADPYTGSINMTGTVDFRIGCSSQGSSTPAYFFDGSLDEVRVYNRALTDDEINQLYMMGK